MINKNDNNSKVVKNKSLKTLNITNTLCFSCVICMGMVYMLILYILTGLNLLNRHTGLKT